MSERVTAEAAPLCGCLRPLVETTKSCTRCGRDVATERFALGARAQAFAGLVADLVLERMQSADSRQRPSKVRIDEQLALGEGDE
jgi:hypothetical protein